MNPPLRHNASLIDALGSSLRRGGHALGTVPALLRQILETEAWRDFETARGEAVHHARFADFVEAQPLKGLGASMDLIDRIVGLDDPDLLLLLKEAKRGRPGRLRQGQEKPVDSTGNSYGAESAAYTIERLAEQAPEEYEAVRRGEKSIHAAALAAGIRRRRISVRLDDPVSAARSLKNHSSPEFWAELKRLVQDETEIS